MRPYSFSEEQLASSDIAIIGVAGRFPGASNVAAYWQNLREGRESVRRLSDEQLRKVGVPEGALRDPSYVKAAAILDDLEQFDARFFGFSRREADVLDPQHRHFLEVCWEALEQAGVVPERFDGPIGVFGGSGMNAYMPYNLFTNPELMRQMGLFLVRHTGNDKDFLTTRASYCLNLRGPAVNVQTACSTSLVAIHLACQSLLLGESAIALAGGVTIELPHYRGYHFQEGEILSPDGHCRPFDASSQGTVFGSGAGVLVLRTLRHAVEHGDYIHAVIKGTAINNDGNRKVGYLAPSVDGQADCITEALGVAGVEARDVSYVECHGTGTPVGDPIEVAALTQAFRQDTSDVQFCGIGSVKSNIGHLDTAAGVASIIKVVEMLKHRELAPTLHFRAANPVIPFESSPFFVVDSARPWQSAPGKARLAGVSSLGVGGTNAHVVVAEAPARNKSGSPARERLLLVSGRSPASRDAAARRLAEHLEQGGDDVELADVESTLLRGRRRFPFCRVLSAATASEAAALLRGQDPKRVFDLEGDGKAREVIFLFPGGGAQYANMSRGVYESEPVFRAQLDRCFQILERQEKLSLKPVLFPEPGGEAAASSEIERPSLALPSLLAIEVSYAALLASWGIKPVAMVGHSVGEYAAAYLASVLSLEDAFRIVCCRGRLFEKVKPGGMLSVPLPSDEVAGFLGDKLAIAAINGPAICVVSGENSELDRLAETLRARDVETQRLHIHIAAHSPLLDPILPEFASELAKVRFASPRIPYASNLSGQLMDARQAPNADYFVRQLRGSVRFSACIDTLVAAHPEALFVEVGPGQALSSLVRNHPVFARAPEGALRPRAGTRLPLPVSPHAKDKTSEAAHLRAILGRLLAEGASVDLDALLGGNERRIVPLPNTPFEHEHHWIDPGQGFFQHEEPEDELALAREEDPERWFSSVVFRASDAPPRNLVPDERWWVLAHPGLLADALLREARARGVRATLIAPGAHTARIDDAHATLTLADPDAYGTLLGQLVAEQGTPSRILHALCLREGESGQRASSEDSFYSLLHLAQALGGEALTGTVELLVATGLAHDVLGRETSNPLHALALGPVRVIPRELPEIRARLFDLDSWQNAESTARALCDELSAPTEEPLVALRSRARFVGRAERVTLPSLEAHELRAAPVFVFTGGLGGVSLVLARAAFEQRGARVVLLSRRELPSERKDAAATGDRALLERWDAVAELRSLGATVLVVAGDLRQPGQVRSALAEVAASLGPIDVVVHTAGTIDDGPLGLKTRASTEGVFAPKVQGTDGLIEALSAAPPRQLVLVSSTSVVLGPPGQIDYVAANAYVDARAREIAAKWPATHVVSLGFGVWRETGMAARAHRPTLAEPAGEPSSHPLLGRICKLADGSREFRSIYRVSERWVLDEHRLRSGAAILPGTGFVELLRAAATQVLEPAASQVLILSGLTLLTPLEVSDDGEREVCVRVSSEPGDDASVQLVVSSRSALDGQQTEHVRASASVQERASRPALDVKALSTRLRNSGTHFNAGQQTLPQDTMLAFGPRWKVVRSMHLDGRDAVAELELPAAYEADLTHYALHPGMLDIASGFAFGLADGAAPQARVRVPLAYERLEVHGPLERKLFAQVRCRSNDPASGVAVFDFTLSDPLGKVLLEVGGYTTVAVASEKLQKQPRVENAAPTLLDRWLALGLSNAEGAAVFARVLGTRESLGVYASPVPLAALAADLAPKAKPVPAHSEERRPAEQGAGASSDEPRDDVEKKLAAIWEALLGVKNVGIHANFFDLGGHSLIAVRLFTQIKKAYGVELSLSVLFDAPTIETTARLVRDALGLSFDPVAAAAPEGASAKPRSEAAPVVSTPGFNPLVLIQAGDGKHPFFCVHGAGGNVLNFRALAIGLGREQTFYGLQAQGVSQGEPLETIEEMAELYLREVRRVQPRGPYLLGGYSGGGVVAYEMAQRLQREGQIVAALVFLDTYAPHTQAMQPPLLTRAARLVRSTPRELAQRARASLKRRADDLNAELKFRFVEHHSLPLPLELRDIKLTRSFAAAALRYRATPYRGRVSLFRATVVSEVFSHVGPKLGWERLIPDLEVVQVPGDHDSLVREPNVRVLTAEVRAALQRSIGPSPQTSGHGPGEARAVGAPALQVG